MSTYRPTKTRVLRFRASRKQAEALAKAAKKRMTTQTNIIVRALAKEVPEFAQ